MWFAGMDLQGGRPQGSGRYVPPHLRNKGAQPRRLLEDWPCPPPDHTPHPDVKAAKNKKPLVKNKEKRNASLPRAFGRLEVVDTPVPSIPKPIKAKKGNVKKKSGALEALRCASPNCSGYVYAPATGCGTPSHGALCVTCAAWRQGRCPLCPPPVPYGDNASSIPPQGRPVAFHLEKLAESLLLPCTFRSKGCHFRFPEEELLLHQVECRFAKKQCFSSKCDFLGDNMELAKHMDQVHAERVVKDTEAEFTIRNINTRTEPVQHIQYLRCIYGEFWVKYEYSRTEEKLYAAVQYIGPKQEAEKLMYQFEMKEYDDNEYTGLKAVYTAAMPTHIKTFETLFDIEDCFSVSLDFAQYFENNDVLKLIVRIKEDDGSI